MSTIPPEHEPEHESAPSDAASQTPTDEHVNAPSSSAPVGGGNTSPAAARGGPTLETVLGWILRVGVTASALLIAAGVVLLFFTGSTGYGGTLSSLDNLVHYSQNAGERFPTTPGEVFSGLVGLHPYALIALGLLVLIATPVVRVAASVLLFWLERDGAYVFLTFLVLMILIISFLLGKAV